VKQLIHGDRAVRLLAALANTTLGLALLAALIGAARHILHTVTVFFLSMLIAYALEPVVSRFHHVTRGHLSRGTSVLLTLVACAGLLMLLLTAAARPTGRQVQELESRAPELRLRADRLAAGADDWLARRHIPFRVAAGAQTLSRLAHDRSLELAQGALLAAGALTS
jgi:predicted PurR-regulated permease PerM